MYVPAFVKLTALYDTEDRADAPAELAIAESVHPLVAMLIQGAPATVTGDLPGTTTTLAVSAVAV
jgi:hypothetical protein